MKKFVQRERKKAEVAPIVENMKENYSDSLVLCRKERIIHQFRGRLRVPLIK